MSVTCISSLRFDAGKKIISALDRVIPCQQFCVTGFLILCLGAEIFKFKVSQVSLNFLRQQSGFVQVCTTKLVRASNTTLA